MKKQETEVRNKMVVRMNETEINQLTNMRK
jgi:hypothetical protein